MTPLFALLQAPVEAGAKSAAEGRLTLFGHAWADPIFGLNIPVSVPGVPDEVLKPRATWADGSAYDAKAKELAAKFRDNAAKFEMSDAVKNAGPKG